MEIDISTLRTELEQRLAVAQGEQSEILELLDGHESDETCWIGGWVGGELHTLNSLLRWLKLYEEAAKDGN